MNCVAKIADIKLRPGCCAEGLEHPVAEDSVVLKFKDDSVTMDLLTAVEFTSRMKLLTDGLLAVRGAADGAKSIIRSFAASEKEDQAERRRQEDIKSRRR